MKHSLPLTLLAMLVFSGAGCSWFNLEPLEDGAAFDVIETYDPPFDTGYPKIELSMSSGRVYPTSGRTIAAGVWAFGPRVSVDILGIECPDILYDMPGPAFSSWPLYVGEGLYLCQISYGLDSDWYALTITDSYIRLFVIEASFTQTASDIFWRHPVNSFAYVCGTTAEDTWIYHDFLDSLTSRVTLTEFGFPDSGRIPYPRSSNGYHRNMPARYFRYQNDSDYEEAGRVLREYSKNVLGQHQGVGIRLVDWKNRQHLSRRS